MNFEVNEGKSKAQVIYQVGNVFRNGHSLYIVGKSEETNKYSLVCLTNGWISDSLTELDDLISSFYSSDDQLVTDVRLYKE